MKPNIEPYTIKISEALGTDSGVITAISMQKKNSKRFSMFVNEVFLIGVSDNCVQNLNLKKGDVLDQALLDKIFEYEARWKVKNFFIRLLSQRDHASLELKQKAKIKGYPSELVDVVIKELNEKGFINNAEFAKIFAHDKFEFNNWGPQKISLELKRKGLNSHAITFAIAHLSNDEISSKMERLIKKNSARFYRVDTFKRKKKIFDFLFRKGYTIDQIMSSMDILLGYFDD